MSRVPLRPIGSPRGSIIDDATFRDEIAELDKLEGQLNERRDEVHAGWGQKYIDRVHKKNKRTARERIERLKDPGTEVFEVGTFVNHGRQFGKLRSPGAGVITAFVRIEHRWCMVIANDNTVASGAWWPMTPEKIERAQMMALRLRVPAIYLVDCSGLFLPEQSKSFSGAKGAGHIFKMNSLLSAEGVPQIAGVFGDCIAGGGYMPIISDRVYMTEQAYMVIAGAALIKGAKSQHITSLDIGGPEVHVHHSGCADVRVPDDDTLLSCVRDEVRKLPSSGADFHRHGAGAIDPKYPATELSGIIPNDHRQAYDALEVLARLCDQSLFWEVLPNIGEEMICGIGRLGGLYAGFVVNRQGLVEEPDAPGQRRPAGILYREGIAKISAFSRACNSDGIPLIWLQDISGFDIGRQAEAQGLLAYGSNLIYTNSTNKVPMFTVLLRKASGAGYYAMAGLPYDPVVQLSTPLSRLSVMEGRTLAIATYNTKLDDEFEIITQDAEERAEIEKGMKEVEARIEKDMDPFVAARQLDTDEIVPVAGLRPWLTTLVEIAYQATGYRRVKNPRIWTMHDLDVLDARNRTRAYPMTAKKDGNTVRSPGVGLFSAAVRAGSLVQPGLTLGTLTVLGVRHPIVAPEGSGGAVIEVTESKSVAYADQLFELDPEATPSLAAADGSSAEASGSELVFKAPMSGRFYRKPGPDKPAFVEVGAVLESGHTVGLLEVMKTFNRLTYGGDALPERAKVVRIVPNDGDDLNAGDPIVEVEPA